MNSTKKKIILITLVVFLVTTSCIPLASATYKTQQKSSQLNTQQDTKNNIKPADAVFIKIFTACSYGLYGAIFPAFCAIKIDGVFRGFSWKEGIMFDSWRCNYWSGYVSVGTHNITAITIILLEGFIKLTETKTVYADTKVIEFWIGL